MRDTLEKLNKQIHNNEDAQLAKKYFNDNIDPLIELIKRKEPKQDEGLNKTTKSWERLRDPSNKHSNFDLKNLANNVNNLIEDQHVINEKTNELNDKINKYRDMINNIPDKNSTKYNDEVLRLKKVDNELETVENIAKEEQEKLDKLKNRLNNVQAAHTAQNYYNDFLKPDLEELHNKMMKQDDTIKNTFKEIEKTDKCADIEDRKKLFDDLKNLIKDLNTEQDKIGDKLNNISDLSKE